MSHASPWCGWRDAPGISCLTPGVVVGVSGHLVRQPSTAMGTLWASHALAWHSHGDVGVSCVSPCASPQAWLCGCRDISCVTQAQLWGCSGHLMRCPVYHRGDVGISCVLPRCSRGGVRASPASHWHGHGDVKVPCTSPHYGHGGAGAPQASPQLRMPLHPAREHLWPRPSPRPHDAAALVARGAAVTALGCLEPARSCTAARPRGFPAAARQL